MSECTCGAGWSGSGDHAYTCPATNRNKLAKANLELAQLRERHERALKYLRQKDKYGSKSPDGWEITGYRGAIAILEGTDQ